MNGFINIIKPKNITSTKVVTEVKHKFKVPCGHMGTLDPMACGVLPVGIEKASRLFDYLLDKTKEYIATFKFGEITDTLDTTGIITAKTNVIPTKEQIVNNLSKFVGEISQIPPKYSSKNVNGQRGYQLARQGVEFELKPKNVIINAFELTKQISESEFEFRIECKGGTYIRSLARDLAESCGSLGVMSALNRTKSGYFEYSNAITLQEFIDCDNPEKYLILPEKVINFEMFELDDNMAFKVFNGVPQNYGLNEGFYKIYYKNEFWGVAKVENGLLRMKSYVR